MVSRCHSPTPYWYSVPKKVVSEFIRTGDCFLVPWIPMGASQWCMKPVDGGCHICLESCLPQHKKDLWHMEWRNSHLYLLCIDPSLPQKALVSRRVIWSVLFNLLWNKQAFKAVLKLVSDLKKLLPRQLAIPPGCICSFELQMAPKVFCYLVVLWQNVVTLRNFFPHDF